MCDNAFPCGALVTPSILHLLLLIIHCLLFLLAPSLSIKPHYYIYITYMFIGKDKKTMKNQFLQVRLSAAEKEKVIEKSQASGMKPSAYIRAVLLADEPVSETGIAQEVMTHTCRIYTLLNHINAPETEQIRGELNAICRALR